MSLWYTHPPQKHVQKLTWIRYQTPSYAKHKFILLFVSNLYKPQQPLDLEQAINPTPNRAMVAQMAERAPHDLKVMGLNPASESYAIMVDGYIIIDK